MKLAPAPRLAAALLTLVIVSRCHSLVAAAQELEHASPEQAGMDPARLDQIGSVVAGEISAGKLPGCVVLIARHGRIVYARAFGHRRLLPKKQEMTTDTVFDLASLTKPIATATSIMLLVERGQLRLNDVVGLHLPEFSKEGKGEITVEQLLTHRSGLVPDNPLEDYQQGTGRAWQNICDLKPIAEPGTKFMYSDVGYIVLGELVRKVSGQDLGAFSRNNIFEPLGMNETGFLPPDELRKRAAPTEQREGHWMQGEVHDPRSFQLGGVAGHAGLFSTAEDLVIYGQMMLGRGSYEKTQVLSRAFVQIMTEPREAGTGFRGLGWDIHSSYSTNRGELFSKSAFGHGGFTGTSMWIDPELDLIVIFLSNRVHPDGKGSVNALAGRIGTIAAAAIRTRSESPYRAEDTANLDAVSR